MLQLPSHQTRSPAAKTGNSADPIFALIDSHKKLQTAWNRLHDQLQEAEVNAAIEHGQRPIALIHWRNYYIGASEIDARREQMLQESEIDPARIELEYLDAKARLQAKMAAEKGWVVRAGLAAARRECDRAVAEQGRCEKRLSRTIPTTPAGAAALLHYILDDDLTPDAHYWHLPALKRIAAALADMGPRP
jgi:hypothetical protein